MGVDGTVHDMRGVLSYRITPSPEFIHTYNLRLMLGQQSLSLAGPVHQSDERERRGNRAGLRGCEAAGRGRTGPGVEAEVEVEVEVRSGRRAQDGHNK